MPDTTILHMFVMIALASALVLSHWQRIQAASVWFYLRFFSRLNINLVIVLCGLILLFLGGILFGLLLEDAPRKHRFVPYHDRNGEFKGMVRIRRNATASAGMSSVPELRPQRKKVHRSPSPPQTAAAPPQRNLSGWDGWPNGFFRTSISSQHVADTDRCAVNWVCDISSDRRGSPSARTAARGLETQYTCLGVIECASRHCTEDMQIAPERQLRLRQRQLDTHCSCGRRLRHLTCGVTCSVVVFRDGAELENSGEHNHLQYSHRLVAGRFLSFEATPPVLFNDGSESFSDTPEESPKIYSSGASENDDVDPAEWHGVAHASNPGSPTDSDETAQNKSLKHTFKRFLPMRKRGSENGDTDDEERAFRTNGVRVFRMMDLEPDAVGILGPGGRITAYKDEAPLQRKPGPAPGLSRGPQLLDPESDEESSSIVGPRRGLFSYSSDESNQIHFPPPRSRGVLAQVEQACKLNGQTLLDILDGSILPLNQDWRNVFFFMYLATDPEELRHKDTFDLDSFKDNRDTFYSDHVTYDPTLHLPKFERRRPSRITDMPPISITVTEAADPEFLGKRKGNKQAESLRPAKRKRKVENGGSDETQKPELRNRVPKLIRKGVRKSRRLAQM
ncbi:hypothetical protein B0H14DRAFT_3451445 [Mycena olivaceomarginata]|nr:hypothetical protein B0H14DRAFT_3451445 [Mycena olivaceomarginata]